MAASAFARAGAAGLAAIAWAMPVTASAHDFLKSAAYESFVEGAGLAMGWPPSAILLCALALFASLSMRESMPSIWLHFIAGCIAGLAIAPWVPERPSGFVLLMAAVVATAAALRPESRLSALRALAAITGATACAALMAGHAHGEVPATAIAGVTLGANMLVAIVAGLVEAGMRHFRRPWLVIAFRAIASWVAAIAVLVLAFEFSADRRQAAAPLQAPSMMSMFWTQAPDAPLPRLSSEATRLTWPAPAVPQT